MGIKEHLNETTRRKKYEKDKASTKRMELSPLLDKPLFLGKKFFFHDCFSSLFRTIAITHNNSFIQLLLEILRLSEGSPGKNHAQHNVNYWDTHGKPEQERMRSKFWRYQKKKNQETHSSRKNTPFQSFPSEFPVHSYLFQSNRSIPK